MHLSLSLSLSLSLNQPECSKFKFHQELTGKSVDPELKPLNVCLAIPI